MITAILVILYLVSLPFLFGKHGAGIKNAPIPNILSLSPLVLFFFDAHLALNIISLVGIGACYAISNNEQYKNSLAKKILIICYLTLACVFILNNLDIFFS